MELRGARVLLLGGSGLVGLALARRFLAHEPARLVIAARTEREAQEALKQLRQVPAAGTELDAAWGDIFVATEFKDRARSEILRSGVERQQFLDDLFGEFGPRMLERSYLYGLLRRERPELVIDCVNTATAIAYQDLYATVEDVRRAVREGAPDLTERVDRHLAMLYMPQMIRHIQILLEGLKAAGTRAYVKVGTSGTGGMGLNIPFTHSEQRPSPLLLSKAGIAGAHTLLLYLMARTPGAPAVKEVKPTAAIAWKRIGVGPIERWGKPIPLYEPGEPVPLERAFDARAKPWKETGRVLEGVYLDAGENGYFSRDEFEAISAIGMMELVTPEEIADAVLWEVQGYPTGRDVVAALDAACYGPSYRGGALRQAALRKLETLEAQFGRRSVAFEILGPPRLSKLLYEAALLERAYGTLEAARDLVPEEAAARAEALVQSESLLRCEIVSIGLPILLADGRRVLRGPEVKVALPAPASPGAVPDVRWTARGWVDLRAENWALWRERIRKYWEASRGACGPEGGSQSDFDPAAIQGQIRPGALVGWIFVVEDEGGRLKR